MRKLSIGDHVQFMEDGYLASSGEIISLDEDFPRARVRVKNGTQIRLNISELRFVSSKEQREAAAQSRRIQNDLLKGLGLKKVRGALGGTYWE